MSLSKSWFDDDVIAKEITANMQEVTVQVVLFQGYRVSACSAEPGGRLYNLTAGGGVIAQDFARCHVELRKVLRNSSDAYGSDADKVEFRYADRAARLEAGSSRLIVPATWFVCSHTSGVGLNELIKKSREIGGHIEAPDQAMQYC